MHHLDMAPRRSNPSHEPEITEPFLVRLRSYIDANKDNGVTAAGLSKQAGLADNAIRRWFAGTSKTLTIASARSVCEAMGTTLEAFLSSAQTEEERAIVGLVSQLPDELLRLLLGYGQGLVDAKDQARPAPPEGEK